MKELKERLKTFTELYKQLQPDDYALVIEDVKTSRDNLINPLADTSKQMHSSERLLIKWPEGLYRMIIAKLTPEEHKAVFLDPKHTILNWYAKEYPEFRVPERV